MTTLNWNESVPSNASVVGDTAAIVSLWTSISQGLATDLYWDGSGGASAASRGELHPGAPRTFVGAQSASSHSGVGRAFLASDTSQLLVYTSTGTFLGGSPYAHFYGGSSLTAQKRELSGFTRVSGITTVAPTLIDITGEFGHVIDQPTTTTVQASDRSVLVRAAYTLVTPNTNRSLILSVRATANGPSATTVHWTMIGESVGRL